MRPALKETSLFYPVRELLESQGYAVKGEVNDIDVLALKDGASVAVELKTALSLKLICQAVERQKYCDRVYVALPKAALKPRSQQYKQLALLLRRLSLGLIAVDLATAEILFDATEIDSQTPARSNSKKKAALTEFHDRQSDTNLGGSRGPTITRYREKVMQIALVLRDKKIATGTQVRLITGLKEAGTILMRNYYGWFERLERGLYRLSESGLMATDLEVEKNVG